MYNSHAPRGLLLPYHCLTFHCKGRVLTGNTAASDRTGGGATMVGWLRAMVPGKVCIPSNTGPVLNPLSSLHYNLVQVGENPEMRLLECQITRLLHCEQPY